MWGLSVALGRNRFDGSVGMYTYPPCVRGTERTTLTAVPISASSVSRCRITARIVSSPMCQRRPLETGNHSVPETLPGSRDLLPPKPRTADHHPEHPTASKGSLTLRRASRDFSTATASGETPCARRGSPSRCPAKARASTTPSWRDFQSPQGGMVPHPETGNSRRVSRRAH